MTTPIFFLSWRRPLVALWALSLASALQGAAPLSGSGSPPDGKIAYVLTSLYWGLYVSTDSKADCPKGTNVGPRDQFVSLFPANKPRTVANTQLAREIQTWHPGPLTPDPFPFYEPAGHTAIGLNLDGKVGPNDFTNSDGEPGIDNNMFRVLGCIRGFRPGGSEYFFEPKIIVDRPYNRLMIELSNVTNLTNTDHVTVTVYRGTDRLLTDATGNTVVAGGSQRIDTRWGRVLVRTMQGKIQKGILTTEPIRDLMIPWMDLEVPTYELIKDARLRLKVSPTGAEGLIGGYADIDTYYFGLLRNNSTHHLAQSDISAQSLYKALKRLGDAYPDSKSGENTAISTALTAKFAQVYINPLTEAQKAQLSRTLPLPSADARPP